MKKWVDKDPGVFTVISETSSPLGLLDDSYYQEVASVNEGATSTNSNGKNVLMYEREHTVNPSKQKGCSRLKLRSALYTTYTHYFCNLSNNSYNSFHSSFLLYATKWKEHSVYWADYQCLRVRCF